MTNKAVGRICYRCGHEDGVGDGGCAAWGSFWKRHWYPPKTKAVGVKVKNLSQEAHTGKLHNPPYPTALPKKSREDINYWCGYENGKKDGIKMGIKLARVTWMKRIGNMRDNFKKLLMKP